MDNLIRRVWSLRFSLLATLVLLASGLISPSVVDSSPVFVTGIREQTLTIGESFEIAGTAGQGVDEFPLIITRSNRCTWEQRFENVHDALELRVVDSRGERGTLIRWEDRGFRGKYTWSYRDPVPEVRDITQFVGDGNSIRLWARIIRLPNGRGDQQCTMDTICDGFRKLRWQFDDTEDRYINR